jgi:acyl-CoA oxidase
MLSPTKRAVRRLGNTFAHLQPCEQFQPQLKNRECSGGEQQQENILDVERAKASFDSRKLTIYLEGSEEYAQFKELVSARIEFDDILCDPQRRDFTRAQARERTMAKIKLVQELWLQSKKQRKQKASDVDVGYGRGSSTTADAFWDVMGLYDPSWATKMGVHYGLFQFAIIGQGTEEQKAKYLDDIAMMNINGCFAMTELGHGSYVRGLETTATYDKQTQEFVLHSPTITSTKWWIGGAGQTATHAVVFARLLIDGEDKGIHSFVVQIRSLEDASPMPGISVGDCGAKMGRNGLDNGWIRFDHVRIPRENMLMKWAKVTPEGTFTQPPKAELTYGALIVGRVGIVKDSSEWLKKALTIAIRYSAIRRQGETDSQILDYQTHQHRLFPILATAFAFHCASKQLGTQFGKVQDEVNQQNLSSLGDMHATSAGLKAFCTWYTNEALEVCRQCLGGHGYSAYSGLPEMLGDFAVMCTWEGDNTVLAQQTARYLIKQVKRAIKGKKLTAGTFSQYLASPPPSNAHWAVSTVEDLLRPDLQLEALRYVAAGLVREVAARLEAEKGSPEEKWNACMVDLVEAAKAHIYYFICSSFVEAVAEAPAELRPVLKKLCDLFSLQTIQANLSRLLLYNFILPAHVVLIRTQIRALYRELRPEAVALVDAFNISDMALNSPLGRKDGNIYEAYFNTVKEAPGAIGVPPFYDTLIKPLLHKQQTEEQKENQ